MAKLDQNVQALMRAISIQESGNKAVLPQEKGIGGASIYQYTTGTWKGVAEKYLGDANAPLTRANENKATYFRIKDWKDSGKNPAQIASMWNAGEGEPDAYKGTFSNGGTSSGTNKYGVDFNVPAHTKKVMANFRNELSKIKPRTKSVLAAEEPVIDEKVEEPKKRSFLSKAFEVGTKLSTAFTPFGSAMRATNVDTESKDRLGEQLKKRGVGALESIGRAQEGGQTPVETGVQVAGIGVGAAYDIIGETVITPALKNLSLATPEIVKEYLGSKGKELLESEGGKKTLEAIERGTEYYKEYKKENPRAAANIEGAANILSEFPLFKAPKAISKTLKPLVEEATVATKKVVKLASEVSQKVTKVRSVKQIKKGKEIYKGLVGTGKKQTKAMDEFSNRFGEDVSDYLVENSIPLKVNKERTKFDTKAIGEQFKEDTLDILDDSLTSILEPYKNAKVINLDTIKTQVKQGIQNSNIPAVDLNQQLKLVDDLMDAEIARFGSQVDPLVANKIKRNFWKLGYDMLSTQKKPTAQAIGRGIAKSIEDVVGDNMVKTINNEMAKAIQAGDFLINISGDAVKGGRLGKGTMRIVGTIAGAKLGVVPALLTGEALMTIVSKLGDVSRLSEKAIKKLRKSGIIPSSVKTTEEAKQFLQEMLKVREQRLLLPEGPIRLPAIQDTSGALPQTNLPFGRQVARPGQLQIPQKATQKAIITPAPTTFEPQAKKIGTTKKTSPAVGETVKSPLTPITKESNLAQEAKKYKSAEEFVEAQLEKGYRSAHQVDTKTSSPITKISEDTLTSFTDEFKRQYGYPSLKSKEVNKLKSIISNPEADVTIYRASPKNELNSGDWVTIDKTYANDIKRQNGGKVYTHTVKAQDLFYPKTLEGFKELPSLNKWGAFQYQSSKVKSQLTDIYNKANKN